MDLQNYLNYVVIAFFTITSPGAAILLAINTSMSLGLRALFIQTLGNILGLFVLSLVAILGVGAVLKSLPLFYTVFKIIGALYLIYLGIIQILNKNTKLSVTQERTKKSLTMWSVFKRGFLVAVTNPKPILFFGAVFPLFIEEKRSVVLQFFIMSGTFLVISFCSLMFYGYISKSAKAWFFDEKRLGIFYKISGGLFVLMGIGLVFV